MTRAPHSGPGGRPAHPIDDAEFNRLRRRLRLAVGALVFVTVVGVFGFVLIGHGEHGLIDAVYMTIITLTTVGFGEIIDMSGNPAGRIFTVFLLLGGMGIVAYVVPMVAALVLEGQIHHIFSRRRMAKTIAALNDHYIVCGDSTTSWHVAEELLRTKRPTVVVAPDEATLAEAWHWLGECPGLVGDASDDETLKEAGIDRAAGLVFCMASEKDNVLGVLTGRRLAPRARIIASSEEPQTEAKLRAAGADAIVSPSRIGGLRMASELVRPAVVTFLDKMLRHRESTLRVEEVTVPQDATVSGQTLASLDVEAIPGAMLLAIRRAGQSDFVFKPAPATALEPGMTLVVMADIDGHGKLGRQFRRATGAFLRSDVGDAD